MEDDKRKFNIQSESRETRPEMNCKKLMEIYSDILAYVEDRPIKRMDILIEPIDHIEYDTLINESIQARIWLKSSMFIEEGFKMLRILLEDQGFTYETEFLDSKEYYVFYKIRKA